MIVIPWIHVVVGLVLLVPLVLRHRDGWKPWMTTVWILGLLIYIGLCHVGLFEPLLSIAREMSQQAVE